MKRQSTPRGPRWVITRDVNRSRAWMGHGDNKWYYAADLAKQFKTPEEAEQVIAALREEFQTDIVFTVRKA